MKRQHEVYRHNLAFDRPITEWDEAIPLGNGKMGALVWGDGQPLAFSLDRHDLWDERKAKQTFETDFNYKKLIELVKKGGEFYKEHNRLFDECYNEVTPTKIPAGKIVFEFGGTVSNVVSTLCLASAVANITVDGDIRMETFLHATQFVGVVKITGSYRKAAVTLKSPAFQGTADKAADSSLIKLGYLSANHGETDNRIYFRQETAEGEEYAVIVYKKTTEDGLYLYFDVASNRDGANWFQNAFLRLEELSRQPYSRLKNSHIKWWRDFWHKSEINIPDRQMSKQYYLSNYFLGSASRRGFSPMPLQGVWTSDNGSLPPWKGDYHHDLNTQMSYWSYMKANHLEEGSAFIDFLWGLVPKAKQTAKEFFDTDGIMMPAVCTLGGNILGGWPQYSLNLVNQIWLCQAFDHYYRYTDDVVFLREKAFPYFEESAKAILPYLTPDQNGKLKLPLSSSPEVYDNTIKSYQSPNTNNDLAFLKYLFQTLAEYCTILNYQEKEIWESYLGRLDDFAVSEDNVLMMNRTEKLPESHRHLGHLMCIYPLRLINYDTEANKTIIDNSILHLEQLGTGYWVGFSFVWMACLYAMQHNGEGAWYQLKLFCDNFVSNNGFHLNGDYKKRGLTMFHYRPFTLEANFGYADALQEMLMQNHNGAIVLFPAIPEHWKETEVSFSQLRGYNGVLVSSKMSKGQILFCDLFSQKETVQKIYNNFGHTKIEIDCSGRQETLVCSEGGEFTVRFQGACTIKAIL